MKTQNLDNDTIAQSTNLQNEPLDRALVERIALGVIKFEKQASNTQLSHSQIISNIFEALRKSVDSNEKRE